MLLHDLHLKENGTIKALEVAPICLPSFKANQKPPISPNIFRTIPNTTPTLSLNPCLTLGPTPTLSLVLTLPLPLAQTLTRCEYWDRASGERTRRMIHATSSLNLPSEVD